MSSIDQLPGRNHPALATAFSRTLAGLLICASGYLIATFPIVRLPLAISVACLAALSAWRPSAWGAVILAALPVFDLAPWSGRLIFDEFDAIVCAVLGVRLWQDSAAVRQPSALPLFALTSLLLASTLASTAITLSGPSQYDPSIGVAYYSPENSLRLAKAAVVGVLCWLAVRRSSDFPGLLNACCVGSAIGGAFVVAVTLLERHQFSGILNLSSDFRVSGSSSAMHVGGAALDAYVILSLPLVLRLASHAKSMLFRLIAIGIVIGLLYVAFVTFSRSTIVIAVAQVAAVTVAGLLGRSALLQKLVTGAIAIAACGGVAYAVCNSSYLLKRLSGTEGDVQIRLDHWMKVNSIRDNSWRTRVLGEGTGTFPIRYATAEGRHLDLPSDDLSASPPYLRVLGNSLVFIDQYVALRAGAHYVLEFERLQRSKSGDLQSCISEKTPMYSRSWRGLRIPRSSEIGVWQNVSVPFSIGGKESRTLAPRRWNLSFFQSGSKGDALIRNVQLLDVHGSNLIANGNFEAGYDRWFFTSDHHLAWHAKNLYLHLLFEQGWLGVAAFLLPTCWALLRLIQRRMLSPAYRVCLAVAICGFLALGVIDSLVDVPRITMVYWLLIGVAAFGRKDLAPPPTSSNDRSS